MAKPIPIVVVLSFLFFFSCKKDKNIGAPTVEILAPAALNTYNVFDTIMVKANVSDAVSLQSVSVYMINSQGAQVLPVYPVTVTSSNMNFSCYYTLNDIHLLSGQYSIVVRAYNGTNTTLAYRQVNINAAPLKITALYAVTRNSSGIHAWQIDTSFNATLAYTQSGDYSSCAISSYYQQLYIAASDSGNVNAVAVPPGSFAWAVTGIYSPTPYFTNVYSYGDAVYISYYNGFIKYYSHLGILQSAINIVAGYYPVKTYVWSNYLFAEEKNIASSQRNLVLYYPQSGVGYEQSALPGPVVAMYGMDNDHVFVFGNSDSGKAYLQLFSISGNNYYSPLILPAGKILSVAQRDAQTYLIGFSNGAIYLYTYNPNSIVPYVNGVTASHLQYDEVNNKIIAASGKYIYEYDFTSQSLTHSANMQDSVLNVQLLYNK